MESDGEKERVSESFLPFKGGDEERQREFERRVSSEASEEREEESMGLRGWLEAHIRVPQRKGAKRGNVELV